MERSDGTGDEGTAENFVALEDAGDSEESYCLTWYRLCSGTYSNCIEKALKYQFVTSSSTEPKTIGGNWQARLDFLGISTRQSRLQCDIVEIGRDAQE